jgi:hypothetical protein
VIPPSIRKTYRQIVLALSRNAYVRRCLHIIKVLWAIRPDWRFVRSVGELQVLTRVSYVMLFAVPVLAGVWTALPIEKAYYLPRSWVWAFLAALSVTLGQVIYQMRAPLTVRSASIDAYVRDNRREYMEQPSLERLEEADSILEDILRLSSIYVRDPGHYHSQVGNIIDVEYMVFNGVKSERTTRMESIFRDHVKNIHGYYASREAFSRMAGGRFYLMRGHVYFMQIDRLRQEVTENIRLETLLQEAARFSSNTAPPNEGDATVLDPAVVIRGTEQQQREKLLHDADKVGYAARATYLLQADQRTLAMITASVFYLAAIVLIGVITIDQTRAVLRAAGWHLTLPF